MTAADAHLRIMLGAVAVVVVVAFLGSLVCIGLANGCFNGSSGEESLKVGMSRVAIDTVRSSGTELTHSILELIEIGRGNCRDEGCRSLDNCSCGHTSNSVSDAVC